MRSLGAQNHSQTISNAPAPPSDPERNQQEPGIQKDTAHHPHPSTTLQSKTKFDVVRARNAHRHFARMHREETAEMHAARRQFLFTRLPSPALHTLT